MKLFYKIQIVSHFFVDMCQGYLLQFIRAVFLNVDLDPDVVPDPVLKNCGVSSKLSKIYSIKSLL